MSSKRSKNAYFSGSKKRRRRSVNKNEMPEVVRSELAASDKGSYYNQEEWLAEMCSRGYYSESDSDDLESQSEEETDNDSDMSDIDEQSEDNENEEEIDALDSFVIISPKILQEMMNEIAVCKMCNNLLKIDPQNKSSYGLGRVWTLKCSNVECISHEFINPRPVTPKIGRMFEINRAFFLAMRSIGKGRAAIQKLTSILNLNQPVNHHSWGSHTKAITKQSETLFEKNLQKEATNAKPYMMMMKENSVRSDDQLKSLEMNIGVSLDGSWNTRGWSARMGIVDVCFEETGKVLDVVFKNLGCTLCKKKKQKKASGEISMLEYLEWYLKHEPDCLLNHDGSSQVIISFLITS